MLKLIDNKDIQDPRINLALEEYALRYLPKEHSYLLLYINTPAVVLGKHQNALEEIDHDFVAERGIRLIRRISGGGAVYHDGGNLNFSFITRYSSERFNNYREFTKPIIAALHEIGVAAQMNARNDIVVAGRKISGNAQFTSRDRMLSHGTLLFDSELDVLNAALKTRIHNIESKSTKSVRSQVANISEFCARAINMRELRAVIIRHIFGPPPVPVYRPAPEEWRQVEELAASKYDTWEWNYGRSPRFSVHAALPLNGSLRELRIDVDSGCIADLAFSGAAADTPELEALRTVLQGTRYERAALQHTLRAGSHKALLPPGFNIEQALSLLF